MFWNQSLEIPQARTNENETFIEDSMLDKLSVIKHSSISSARLDNRNQSQTDRENL